MPPACCEKSPCALACKCMPCLSLSYLSENRRATCRVLIALHVVAMAFAIFATLGNLTGKSLKTTYWSYVDVTNAYESADETTDAGELYVGFKGVYSDGGILGNKYYTWDAFWSNVDVTNAHESADETVERRGRALAGDGAACEYTDAVTTYAVNVAEGETQQLFAIPATQQRTWIQLDATADIDLKLETSAGVVLLDFPSRTNWANEMTVYTYNGMTFDFCVDGCTYTLTAGPYYDGKTYTLTGSSSYRSEYIYVDGATTEDLVLSAVGHAAGSGTVSILYDCPAMLSADLEQMDASLKEVLDAMEAALEKTAYVAGDSYTLADVVATAFLARVHVVKDETMFGPRTAACWNDKYKTRPSFQKAYCLWKWDQSLMFKQIEVFADGGDPESVKWTGPPSVVPTLRGLER